MASSWVAAVPAGRAPHPRLLFLRRHLPEHGPEAITAFLASHDFEDALRKAVSLRGDSDTLACIICGIAQAYYKEISASIAERVVSLLERRSARCWCGSWKMFGAYRFCHFTDDTVLTVAVAEVVMDRTGALTLLPPASRWSSAAPPRVQ